MSATYRVNFQIANTEDLRQSFALTDSDAVPIDLTGAQLRMGLEIVPGQSALEASTANGRIVVAAATVGQFVLAIPAASLHPLGPGVYQHDLIVTLASGHIHRVWTGALTLQRGVTQ